MKILIISFSLLSLGNTVPRLPGIEPAGEDIVSIRDLVHTLDGNQLELTKKKTRNGTEKVESRALKHEHLAASDHTDEISFGDLKLEPDEDPADLKTMSALLEGIGESLATHPFLTNNTNDPSLHFDNMDYPTEQFDHGPLKDVSHSKVDQIDKKIADARHVKLSNTTKGKELKLEEDTGYADSSLLDIMSKFSSILTASQMEAQGKPSGGDIIDTVNSLPSGIKEMEDPLKDKDSLARALAPNKPASQSKTIAKTTEKAESKNQTAPKEVKTTPGPTNKPEVKASTTKAPDKKVDSSKAPEKRATPIPTRTTTQLTKPPEKKAETTLTTSKTVEPTKPPIKKTEPTKPPEKKPEPTKPPEKKAEPLKTTEKKVEPTKPPEKKVEPTKPPEKKPEPTKPSTMKAETTKSPSMKATTTMPPIKTESTKTTVKTDPTKAPQIEPQTTKPPIIKAEGTKTDNKAIEQPKDIETTTNAPEVTQEPTEEAVNATQNKEIREEETEDEWTTTQVVSSNESPGAQTTDVEGSSEIDNPTDFSETVYNEPNESATELLEPINPPKRDPGRRKGRGRRRRTTTTTTTTPMPEYDYSDYEDGTYEASEDHEETHDHKEDHKTHRPVSQQKVRRVIIGGGGAVSFPSHFSGENEHEGGGIIVFQEKNSMNIDPFKDVAFDPFEKVLDDNFLNDVINPSAFLSNNDFWDRE